jgi:L-arabinokinase
MMSQEDPAQRIWVRSTDWYRPLTRWLRDLPAHEDPRVRTYFSYETTLIASRAPGRLDFMGGAADEGGALALEVPLADATYAVLQGQESPSANLMTIVNDEPQMSQFDLGSISRGELDTPEAIHARFNKRSESGWVAHIVGLLYYLFHRIRRPVRAPFHGFRLLIHSDVPSGRGLGSSAALEVACMNVLSAFYGIDMEPGELARACQWVEHNVVGSSGGIMDQMTVVFGRHDRMLRLRCQPAQIEGYPPLPAGYQCFGIDAGKRHPAGIARSQLIRTAAQMGYRMLAEAAGLIIHRDGARLVVDDPLWRGYLANIAPDEYRSRYGSVLPDQMQGRDFLGRFQGVSDPDAWIDPNQSYPIRHATEHPIFENERVQRFADAIAQLPNRAGAASEVGALMEASHAAYAPCGLGCTETDLLVELVRRDGPARGLFGAKLTGRGGGGAVAVFGTRDSEAALREIVRTYLKETRKGGDIYVGTSPGAAAVGLLTLRPSLFSSG